MKQLNLFIELTRLKRPIGYMLLFWPCAWGLTLAYDLFADAETLDINLILGGPGGGSGDTADLMDTHVTMLTDLVEKRKDCVAFVSQAF